VASCRLSDPGDFEAVLTAIGAVLIGIEASCCTKPINELLFSTAFQAIVNCNTRENERSGFWASFNRTSSELPM